MSVTLEQRVIELEQELTATRVDAAKVIRALDASCQFIDALLAWLPEGLVLSERVKIAKGQWTFAMREIQR